MTTLGWERLNIYGKVAVLNTGLGLVLFVAVEGTRYPYEGVVFLGIAALTVTVAIYRNSSKGDPEQYPQDREDGASEREKKRQKEMEGEREEPRENRCNPSRKSILDPRIELYCGEN